MYKLILKNGTEILLKGLTLFVNTLSNSKNYIIDKEKRTIKHESRN